MHDDQYSNLVVPLRFRLCEVYEYDKNQGLKARQLQIL